MLRGEDKASCCTKGVFVELGRTTKPVDGNGVGTPEDRPKETGEDGMVTGVVTTESAAVDKDERETGAEDDRVVLGDKD
jgi:hypothetical protein